MEAVARSIFCEKRIVNDDVKVDWIARINAIPHGEEWELTLEPRDSNRRSNRANRFYFKTVVTLLARFLMSQEEKLATLERAKDVAHYWILVPEILGYDEVVIPSTGQVVMVPKPTRTLSKHDFYDYVDRAIVWVHKYTTVLLPPKDYPALPPEECDLAEAEVVNV